MTGKPGRHKAADASQASWSHLCAIEAELGAEKAKKTRNRAAGVQPQAPVRVLFFKRYL